MEYRIADIQKVMNAGGQLVSPDDVVSEILTDSRNITPGASGLFFAISGVQHDGHKYIGQAHARGVRNFVVERLLDYGFTDANFLLVDNSIVAMQKLAAFHRKQFTIPVIGITGSNGKTIVKEWLYFLLRTTFSVCRSPKSFNSQIGVPLSVWQLNTEHQIGIFEAGISQPGEMHNLAEVINSTIGIFTNIGSAHDAGFKSADEKAEEKLKLFAPCKQIIYCKDHALIHDKMQKFNATKIAWSRIDDSADWYIKEIHRQQSETHFTLVYNTNEFEIRIPFADDASIENAVHAFIAAYTIQQDAELLIENMQHLPAISMRLELKKGVNNCTLINDVYSADLASLEISLHFLNRQSGFGDTAQRKHVILSDIDGSGETEENLYRKVVALLQQHNIDRFTGVGAAMQRQKILFENISASKQFFLSTEDALQHIHASEFSNEIILLKGARRFTLERISNLLSQRTHGTVLQVHMHHIAHNLQVYRSLLQPGVKMMVMVKAFSYGSGTSEIANLLAFNRVDYLAVAYADEGVELRRSGVHLPIMVMNPEPDTFPFLVQYQLEPEIYNFRILELLNNYLLSEKSVINPLQVHIKIDTGMHRLGFDVSVLNALIAVLQKNKLLHVASVFSHLAAADENAFDDFTTQQMQIFDNASQQMIQMLGYPVLRHILNTPGISKFLNAQFDMVRLGIGLYGDDPSKHISKKLLPVSSLITTVTQIKNIQAGESVGYGRSYIANAPMRIAILNIGYADGFRRSLGNGVAKIWINGNTYPVVGRVCMDMIMVDITHADNIAEGDTAEIFGEHISLQQFAEWMQTIPYEVLTGISQRVKRVYVEEG